MGKTRGETNVSTREQLSEYAVRNIMPTIGLLIIDTLVAIPIMLWIHYSKLHYGNGLRISMMLSLCTEILYLLTAGIEDWYYGTKPKERLSVMDYIVGAIQVLPVFIGFGEIVFIIFMCSS